MTKFVRLALIAIAVSAMIFPAAAQEFRGTLSGSVSDPDRRAKLLAAQVVLTETHTGTKIESASDSAGQYTIPFLAPGDYDITVTKDGFKAAIRKSVHVGSGDHPVIDVKLDVGNTTQSIEVAADASMINSENASVGQSITHQRSGGLAAERTHAAGVRVVVDRRAGHRAAVADSSVR